MPLVLTIGSLFIGTFTEDKAEEIKRHGTPISQIASSLAVLGSEGRVKMQKILTPKRFGHKIMISLTAPLFPMHGYNLNFIFSWDLSPLVFALCGMFIFDNFATKSLLYQLSSY